MLYALPRFICWPPPQFPLFISVCQALSRSLPLPLPLCLFKYGFFSFCCCYFFFSFFLSFIFVPSKMCIFCNSLSMLTPYLHFRQNLRHRFPPSPFFSLCPLSFHPLHRSLSIASLKVILSLCLSSSLPPPFRNLLTCHPKHSLPSQHYPHPPPPAAAAAAAHLSLLCQPFPPLTAG